MTDNEPLTVTDWRSGEPEERRWFQGYLHELACTNDPCSCERVEAVVAWLP